jgi:hypothetical protein
MAWCLVKKHRDNFTFAFYSPSATAVQKPNGTVLYFIVAQKIHQHSFVMPHKN